MIHLKETLKCCALAACTATLVCFALAAISLKRTTDSIPKRVADAVAEFDGTRADIRTRIDRLQGELQRQADALRKTLDARSASMEAMLDRQATQYHRTLAAELSRTNASLEQVSSASRSSLEQVASVAAPIKATAEQVSAAAPMFLDCDHNADCFFNRYVGTMRGIERASVAVGKAAPGTTQAVEGIAAAGNKIATKLAADLPWWRKAISAIPYAGWLVSTVH